MKQFSLEEYLADPSKKVVTRDGKDVRIICTDARGEYPIIALVEYYDGSNDNIYSYTKDGVYYPIEPSEEDLFFASEAPEKHEGWINIYKFSREGSAYYGSTIWTTEEEAKSATDSGHVATVKIEWEE